MQQLTDVRLREVIATRGSVGLSPKVGADDLLSWDKSDWDGDVIPKTEEAEETEDLGFAAFVIDLGEDGGEWRMVG
jgi:hypothetical protein